MRWGVCDFNAEQQDVISQDLLVVLHQIQQLLYHFLLHLYQYIIHQILRLEQHEQRRFSFFYTFKLDAKDNINRNDLFASVGRINTIIEGEIRNGVACDEVCDGCLCTVKKFIYLFVCLNLDISIKKKTFYCVRGSSMKS